MAAATSTEQLQAALDHWVNTGAVGPFQQKVLQSFVDARQRSVLAALDMYPKETQRDKLLEAVTNAALEETEKTWNSLFTDMSTEEAKKISRSERDALGVVRNSYVYGEVAFLSFGIVLWGLKLRPGGVFYDLGSGSGRGVIAAALLHNFDRIVGIEVLSGLHKASNEVLKKYDKDIRSFLPANEKGPQIEFVRKNFLQYDWSDADVVFANSTCYDSPLMNDIAERTGKLRPGAYVITTTKPLETPVLKLLQCNTYVMSWGEATVYVHQRVDPSSADSSAPAAAAQ